MNNKPKTFEDFYVSNGKFEMNGTTKSYEQTWNARDALAKEEIEAIRQDMQAEIDKRDARIKEFEKYVSDGFELSKIYMHDCRMSDFHGTCYPCLLEERYYAQRQKLYKELNQRGKDEPIKAN